MPWQRQQHHDAKNRARKRAMPKSRGQACYDVRGRENDPAGRGGGSEGGGRLFSARRRAKERSGTGSGASQRRQDRRRQPAITSWNVWERVGLDPKGPTTTKLPPTSDDQSVSEAPTLYRVTPGKRRGYLPIAAIASRVLKPRTRRDARVAYRGIARDRRARASDRAATFVSLL